MKHPIFCLALAISAFFASQTFCFATAADSPHAKTTIDPKQDLLNPPENVPIGKYRVTLWLNIPHDKYCKDQFRAMPYLSEPPKAMYPYGLLPERYSDLTDLLYSQCYAAPSNRRKHPYYSSSSWRMTYALETAKREAHLSPPYFLPQAHAWCDQMYPYLHKYVVRSNDAERLRFQRYHAAQEHYEEDHTEIEYAALKKGLYPVDLNFVLYHLCLRRAMVDLQEGKWWITGTHKIAGITYYWEEPIEVGPGKPNALELTEANALLIDGKAW